MNVAIDGPAGAGKSTIAKTIAAALGSIYVDTGAMYRAMAVYMLERNAADGLDVSDEAAVSEAAKDAKITIRHIEGEQHVFLNGEDVNGRLRTEEIGNTASAISVFPKVRSALVDLQRELAEHEAVVMDGRDIGTVVLPDAEVKIYLDASPRVRAERRVLQLKEKGVFADASEVEKDIIERDRRDMNRAASPLKKAEDAVLVDSSEMTLDEVVDTILSICKKTREGV